MRHRLLAQISLVLIAASSPTGGAEGQTVSAREATGKVEGIHFSHVRHKPLKNWELRAAMQTLEGQPFQRRFFLNDLGTIENLYRGQGYMGVEIQSKRLEVTERGRLSITLKIDSGVRWKVADVRLQLSAAFDTTALEQRLAVRDGDVFRYGKVLQSERELQTYLNSQGYAHAEVRNELSLDPSASTASVIYHVHPGPRMYVDRIDITGGAEELHTRPSLVRRYLTFEEGDLYNPEELGRSRSSLARTDLFRSVTMSTPAGAEGDSLQPVEIRLREKDYLRLGANFLLNNTAPRIAGNVQHGNWLGRGGQLGLDASMGQPVQGSTAYLTERNLFRSGADLTVSAGVTEEWGSTQAPVNPDDPLQFDLLTTHDTVANVLLLLSGPEDVAEYLLDTSYDYRSVERLWKLNSTLARTWEPSLSTLYEVHLSVAWTRSATRAIGDSITYDNPVTEGGGLPNGEDPDDPFPDDPDDPFPDDPFPDDPFPEEDPTGDGTDAGASDYVDYSDGKIPVDRVWKGILAQKSRALNFSLGLERDTRDSPIAPSRGSYARVTGLYAIQFGGRATRVLDGEFEARHYQPLGDHFVWAQALRLEQTASVRRDRPLPRAYWKEFGGEGTVRGVDRNTIQAVGGGRIGINLRNELRWHHKGYGLVVFWDRGDVWRHRRDVAWSGMVDGYGWGVRYTMGIPFRLDMAWSDGFTSDWRDVFNMKGFYFSIGQAF